MRVPRIDRARLIQGSTSPSQRCGRPVATQPQPTRMPTCAARRFLSVLLLAACLLLLPPVIRSSATARCSAFRALAHSSGPLAHQASKATLPMLPATHRICWGWAWLSTPLDRATVRACRSTPRIGPWCRRPLGCWRPTARPSPGIAPARNRSAQQQPPTTRPQLRIRVPPHPTGTTRSGGAAKAGQTQAEGPAVGVSRLKSTQASQPA